MRPKLRTTAVRNTIPLLFLLALAALPASLGALQARGATGQDSPPQPLQMVADETKELKGFCWAQGLITYGFKVPGKGSLRVTLHHPNETFISLRMTNKWNRIEGGMLENKLRTAGDRIVTFRNPSDQMETVYVVVRDRNHYADKDRPFTLEIRRDEDAAPKPSGK